jgi:hypothetical protein
MRSKPRSKRVKTPRIGEIKPYKVPSAPKVRSVLRKDHARRTKLA